MAKAPTPPAADGAGAPKKSKKLLIIVLVLVVVLLLAGIGVVTLLLLKKGGGHDEAAAPAPAPAEVAAAPGAVDLSKPPTFVPLDPFVVNLAAGEGDRLLQVVIALRVVDAKTGEGLKGFMPEIRHRINLILRGKLPSELGTPEGQEALAVRIAEDINEILGFPPNRGGARSIGSVPGVPIQAVLFNSIIIQ
ncbi:MAG: flagellar basal body-associated FliL family protein [Zoogloeaceae bacterium]|nr:flagellar basal body-associated FliL family protein [Zoogloeaceae bacterium]